LKFGSYKQCVHEGTIAGQATSLVIFSIYSGVKKWNQPEW
jgi:hypothetical protein